MTKTYDINALLSNEKLEESAGPIKNIPRSKGVSDRFLEKKVIMPGDNFNSAYCQRDLGKDGEKQPCNGRLLHQSENKYEIAYFCSHCNTLYIVKRPKPLEKLGKEAEND